MHPPSAFVNSLVSSILRSKYLLRTIQGVCALGHTLLYVGIRSSWSPNYLRLALAIMDLSRLLTLRRVTPYGGCADYAVTFYPFRPKREISPILLQNGSPPQSYPIIPLNS